MPGGAEQQGARKLLVGGIEFAQERSEGGSRLQPLEVAARRHALGVVSSNDDALPADVVEPDVAEFGVHEKDMSCTYIAELGRRAGFQRHLVLQRPHQILRSLYRPSYAKGSSSLDLKIRLFLSKLRVIRHLFHRFEDKFIVLWK